MTIAHAITVSPLRHEVSGSVAGGRSCLTCSRFGPLIDRSIRPSLHYRRRSFRFNRQDFKAPNSGLILPMERFHPTILSAGLGLGTDPNCCIPTIGQQNDDLGLPVRFSHETARAL